MGYETISLDSRQSALVIIDMENEFCKPGGKLYHPDGVDEVIPNCRRLLEKSRASGVTTIFVQSVRDPDSPEFVRFGHFLFLLRGTWGCQYIEELEPRRGELVIEKNTHDCFYKTQMDATLERLGILPETHQVVVFGIAANICVYHAVVGFHVRHYKVVVPIDCCAGWAEGIAMLETQIRSPAYNYNVAVTRSEMITFNGQQAASRFP